MNQNIDHDYMRLSDISSVIPNEYRNRQIGFIVARMFEQCSIPLCLQLPPDTTCVSVEYTTQHALKKSNLFVDPSVYDTDNVGKYVVRTNRRTLALNGVIPLNHNSIRFIKL